MVSKAERTRRRILDAAAECLAEHGYAGTSLPLIAERIDMQGASLYYHFASKDELVFEVLRLGTVTAKEAVADAVIRLGDDADPVEALRAAIVAHLTAVLAQGPYTTANIRSYGQLPDELAERHRAEQRSYATTWRTLIADAIASGALRTDLDPRAVRLLLLGAMNWTIEWFDPDGLDPRQLGELLADMVLDGLRSREHRS